MRRTEGDLEMVDVGWEAFVEIVVKLAENFASCQSWQEVVGDLKLFEVLERG